MPLASVKVRDDDRANVEPSAVAGISAFLGKLWKMVEDPKTDHLISWGKTGNSFVIKNQIDFAKTILPNYYKHNNIASFIRQLNMYGFHKIISTTSGSLDSSDNDEIEFMHPCFVRGNPYLLEQIKRKMNNPKENIVKTENNNQFTESMKRVLNDIKNLKGKQEHLGSQLGSVKQENEILWRELSLLRQKHAAQQNVLNKLIRFLVSLAQPSSNHGLVKRRLVPLMLKDSASNTKHRPSYYEGDHAYTFRKRAEPSPGTTIHEIHSSELPDDVQIIETPILDDDSSVIRVDREVVTSPAPSLAASDLSVSSSSPEPVPAALLLPSSRKGEKRLKTVYLAPSSQVPQHFLASRNRRVARSKSPEYLIPEQTDNPLLELVHDTELAVDDDDDDDDNNYVTIAAGGGDDGAELNDANITLKLVNDPRSSATYNLVPTLKNKVPIRRRHYAKKESVLARSADKKPTSVQKTDRKKKLASDSGERVASTGNEFLFGLDMNNYTEPLIEVHTPSSTTSPQNEETTTDAAVNIFPTSDEENLTVPITVEDMMDLPNTTNPNSLQIEQPTIVDSQQIMQALSPNKQQSSPAKQTSIAFSAPETRTPFTADTTVTKTRPTTAAASAAATAAVTDQVLMEQINNCANNAQNMKIACTENKTQPTQSTLESAADVSKELSMQLDGVQTSLNNLKELMHSGGLALDMDTLYDIFNDEPGDYNNPIGNSSNLHRVVDDKVEGNELMCNQPMFDFNDLLQNDWCQPTTSYHTIDAADYCNLNTPQINESGEETPPSFPPAKKIRSN